MAKKLLYISPNAAIMAFNSKILLCHSHEGNENLTEDDEENDYDE